LLSQKGLCGPAESAEVSLAEGVYTHFVAPDDLTKGEGRYRNELRRMKEIFERATPFSLVILDEPCGGTSFEEGQRQSLALLDGFHRLGSTTYFTTHMHMVAREVDSGRYPAAKNLSVECSYDGKRIHYTYKVREGAFGKSFGEEIAREIGLMPEGITETISKRAEEKGFKSILRG
jgi:DNA mismatch repair protein MutS